NFSWSERQSKISPVIFRSWGESSLQGYAARTSSHVGGFLVRAERAGSPRASEGERFSEAERSSLDDISDSLCLCRARVRPFCKPFAKDFASSVSLFLLRFNFLDATLFACAADLLPATFSRIFSSNVARLLVSKPFAKSSFCNCKRFCKAIANSRGRK